MQARWMGLDYEKKLRHSRCDQLTHICIDHVVLNAIHLEHQTDITFYLLCNHRFRLPTIPKSI